MNYFQKLLRGLLPGLLMIALATPPILAQVTQEWVVSYNGPGNDGDDATGLALDGNGNVYVTGSSTGIGTGYDYATAKYNSAGVQQWVSRFNGLFNGYDFASSIAVDGSGNVYVTGWSPGSWGDYDYVTVKYNTLGQEQWVARYNGSGNANDHATGVAVDGDGNVYVTGRSTGSVGLMDYATVKYNSAGQQQWVQRYNGPGNADDFGTSLAVDGYGGVYVTGYSMGIGTNLDYATIKYNAIGQQLWVSRYNGPGNGDDCSFKLAVDGDGSVSVTGFSLGSVTLEDYATIKYNTNGQEQWVSRYNGPGNFWDYAHGLAVDGNGNVYVTGESSGLQIKTDYATIKYNSSGQQQWVARYNGPGDSLDYASSLAVDSEGNAYVTGWSYGSGTNWDYATIKYNATGQEQWVMRFNGQANNYDKASSLAVDSNRNVYVTGYSLTDWWDDYTTIKYSQSTSPSLVINTSPVNPPVTIPANGGSFQYNINVQNLTTQSQTFSIWNKVRDIFNVYTQVFGPITRSLPGGANPTRVLTQTIAGSISSGTLYFISYIGTYPSIIQDSSYFTITKLATGGGSPWIAESYGSGDFFDEYTVADVGATSASGGSPLQPTISATPNPFNPTTVLSYELRAASFVNLSVYDISGRKVAELVNGMRDAGIQSVTFDASGLASGIYLYKLEAGNFTTTKKLILLK